MTTRLSIFPLTGAVLFPGLQLPLHIFEPRYRALVGNALVRDRRIAMIQPQRAVEGAPLYQVGCVGRIGEIQAMEDGRYNLILEGEQRFRLVRELDVTTAFRQIEAELLDEDEDETLSHAQRGGFEREARRFADNQGYSVDWDWWSGWMIARSSMGSRRLPRSIRRPNRPCSKRRTCTRAANCWCS